MPAQTSTVPRYVVQDEIIIDTRSHLIWQRCSVGQHWDGSRCAGEIKLMNWYEAQEKANGDWRLPTKSELEQLVDQARKAKSLAPFIDETAFPSMNQDTLLYWTRSKGVTACFGTGFGVESRSIGFSGGFLPCFIPGAVRLVKGKLKTKTPWAE